MFTGLIEHAKEDGLPDDDLASAIHAANTALQFALGAARVAKRARLGVSPQAVGGASVKRAVRPGQRLGAGQRVPKLTKAPNKKEKDKKRAKFTVVVGAGPLTKEEAAAAAAAKKEAEAKAKARATSARVAAEFASTAGAACASARVKRKASGA